MIRSVLKLKDVRQRWVSAAQRSGLNSVAYISKILKAERQGPEIRCMFVYVLHEVYLLNQLI